jgi:hypothetical protein
MRIGFTMKEEADWNREGARFGAETLPRLARRSMRGTVA